MPWIMISGWSHQRWWPRCNDAWNEGSGRRFQYSLASSRRLSAWLLCRRWLGPAEEPGLEHGVCKATIEDSVRSGGGASCEVTQ